MRSHREVSPWTILGLATVVLGPVAFVILPERILGPSPAIGAQLAVQILYCGLPLFLLWIVLSKERLPLSSVGLRRPDRWTVPLALAIYAVSALVLPIVSEPLLRLLGTEGLERGMNQLVAMPLWFRVFVGATGGVIEELLYRGYAVERLASITRRPWLGGAIAALVFGLAHVPMWGWGFALGADLPFGIFGTAVYLWRRDLVANMLAHSVGLVVAMVAVVP